MIHPDGTGLRHLTWTKAAESSPAWLRQMPARYRFAAFHELEGAFGRRALTERAKGILMERHALDEEGAFALLREHARRPTAA